MRVVIDTNILLEGLNRTGTCGEIIDCWVGEKFTPCVSTALALEYESVLMRHGGANRRELVGKALQALLHRAEYVPVMFSYRPCSPDPGDDLIIDCAMNARAAVVTANIKDFKSAAEQLGFGLFTPEQFLKILR